MQELVAQLEPPAGSVIVFEHRYESGTAYTFCALRVDSPNSRRWYLSGGSSALRGSAPDSPCSFASLFDFADSQILVATAWEPIRLVPPVAAEPV